MTDVFNFSAPLDFRALRAVLHAAGYTRDTVAAASSGTVRGGIINVAEFSARISGPGKFNTLARLFLLAREVPRGLADEALAPIGAGPLIAFGLLHDAGSVRAEAALAMFGDLAIVRDFEPTATGRDLAEDHVLGVGFASTLLTSLTVRRGGETALDIGAGQGVQALMMARHAARVIGTDVNRRALAFARVNGLLNGADIEWREGSLLDPVREMRGGFDLIVSNPPFVMSPHASVALGGVRSGDALCEELVRGVPDFLKQGGFATVLANWGHEGEKDWEIRPRGWVEGGGCDAWLIRLKCETPRQYARRWVEETNFGVRGQVGEPAAADVDEWERYFERLKIGAISFGALVLRRREGANWWRADSLALDAVEGDAGPQVGRIFENETLLRGISSPEAMLERRLQLTPDHRMEQTMVVRAGGWQVQAARLRYTDGIAFPIGVDGAVGALLAACDGTRTVREAAERVAEAAGVSREEAIKGVVPMVGRLMRLGYLFE